MGRRAARVGLTAVALCLSLGGGPTSWSDGARAAGGGVGTASAHVADAVVIAAPAPAATADSTGADPRDVDTGPDRLRLARNVGAVVAVLALLVVGWWLTRS